MPNQTQNDLFGIIRDLASPFATEAARKIIGQPSGAAAMLRDRAAYNALNGSGAPFADMYLGSPGDSDFAAVNNAPAGAGRSIPFNLIPIALLGIIVFLLWKR